MLDNLRQDCCRINYYQSKQPGQISLMRILFEAIRNAGFRAVVLYRLGNWFHHNRMRMAAAFVERLMHHWCHCWISTVVDIGPGFVVAHVCGIVIDGAVGPIGKNFTIRQNATIGGNYGKSKNGRVQPIIGDNVSVGPGACILGPITIGSNTIIGANAVVTTDIPKNSVVGTMRAEVIAERDEEGNIQHYAERFTLSRRELFDKVRELSVQIEELRKKISS